MTLRIYGSGVALVLDKGHGVVLNVDGARIHTEALTPLLFRIGHRVRTRVDDVTSGALFVLGFVTAKDVQPTRGIDPRRPSVHQPIE